MKTERKVTITNSYYISYNEKTLNIKGLYVSGFCWKITMESKNKDFLFCDGIFCRNYTERFKNVPYSLTAFLNHHRLLGVGVANVSDILFSGLTLFFSYKSLEHSKQASEEGE